MGCGSVVQNPGPLGLFDAHAGNEPSALHVQNQVQPFPPTYPYSLSFLLFSMNTPLSNPLLQSPFHQSPCNNMCPNSTKPSWSSPRNIKSHYPLQAPKYLLCCVSPLHPAHYHYHGYLHSYLPSPLQWMCLSLCVHAAWCIVGPQAVG